MKKKLKRIKQSADYSAMESGNHYKNGANPKSQTSKMFVAFGIGILMISLFLFGCKKNAQDDPDNNDEPNPTEITGQIDLPESVKYEEVKTSNLLENSNLNREGGYALSNDGVVFAYNKDQKLIYTGIAGNNSSEFTLNAKETAIYYSLLSFGCITSIMETQNDIQAYKDLLYSFEEVKNLERKIQSSVENRGYFEVEDAKNELQKIFDRISNSFFSNFPDLSASFPLVRSQSLPVTWNPKFNRDLCLDTTMISGKDDVYDNQSNTWTLTRNLYSGRASIVGVKQAKLNSVDNLYYPVGDWIKFTAPYFPKTAGLSVTDNYEMLVELFSATKELITSDLSFWETFAEMKTYSKKVELSFIYREGYTDGIVLLSGRDDETISLINSLYSYISLVSSSIKGFDNLDGNRNGMEQFEDNLIKFLLSKYAYKIPNMALMVKNAQWEEVAKEMTGIIQEYLEYFIEDMIDEYAKSQFKSLAYQFAKEADIIFGPWSKILAATKTGTQFITSLLSNNCPSIAIGFTPKSNSQAFETISFYQFADGVVKLKKSIIDSADYRTNFDGGNFYKSSLILEVESGGVKQQSVIDTGDDLYTLSSKGMNPCMLIDLTKKVIYVFTSSKTPEHDYGMDGYVYRIDAATKTFQKETVFTGANFGWFSFFGGSDNGNPELWHFSFAGYYALLSQRNEQGTWSTQNAGSINPGLVDKQYFSHKNILVTGSAGIEVMSFQDDGSYDNLTGFSNTPSTLINGITIVKEILGKN